MNKVSEICGGYLTNDFCHLCEICTHSKHDKTNKILLCRCHKVEFVSPNIPECFKFKLKEGIPFNPYGHKCSECALYTEVHKGHGTCIKKFPAIKQLKDGGFMLLCGDANSCSEFIPKPKNEER